MIIVLDNSLFLVGSISVLRTIITFDKRGALAVKSHHLRGERKIQKQEKATARPKANLSLITFKAFALPSLGRLDLLCRQSARLGIEH